MISMLLMERETISGEELEDTLRHTSSTTESRRSRDLPPTRRSGSEWTPPVQVQVKGGITAVTRNCVLHPPRAFPHR